MLTLIQLENMREKVKTVTGIYAWFNDKPESTDTIKFDLKYKGLEWKVPLQSGIIRYDLVLCGKGIGAAFNLNLINAEIEMSEAFEIMKASDKTVHWINDYEYIQLLWNDDEAVIEPETTTNGITFNYKRYFKLNYCFKNS